MKNTTVFILLLTFLLSCNNKDESRSTSNTIKDDEIYCVNVSSPQETDNLFLQAYSSGICRSTSAEMEGKSIFFGYNKKLHSIDMINLSEKKPFKQILLSKDGPNSVGLMIVGIALLLLMILITIIK